MRRGRSRGSLSGWPGRGGATGADGPATGRRLHGLRLEARLDEAVMQELLGVEEGQRARARAEHDHEELLAAAPGGHGEVVAGLLREARLERLHAARIAEERDVARVDAAAVDECLAAEQRPRHRVVLDQSPGERGEVARVAPLDGI